MTQLKPNAERAKKVKIILTICIAIAGLYLLQSLYDLYSLSAFKNGRNFYIQDYLDRKDPLSALSTLNLISSLLAIVYFIQWFRRVYFNLHLRVGGLKYGEAAAAWSWFVPILNFFVPLLIMREIPRDFGTKWGRSGGGNYFEYRQLVVDYALGFSSALYCGNIDYAQPQLYFHLSGTCVHRIEPGANHYLRSSCDSDYQKIQPSGIAIGCHGFRN